MRTNDAMVSGANNVVVTATRTTTTGMVLQFGNVLSDASTNFKEQGGRERPPHSVRS